ncbi:unnamed protein product [Amoebophrya sp. A25]|nr:unnamed protein product [Amoebophrya sp. A25]|eukprot:GSA25T00023393001.1
MRASPLAWYFASEHRTRGGIFLLSGRVGCRSLAPFLFLWLLFPLTNFFFSDARLLTNHFPYKDNWTASTSPRQAPIYNYQELCK